MNSRLTLLAGLVLLTIIVFSGVTEQNQTLAADYSCRTATCPNIAQCTGDHWSQSGTCAITCYKEAGAPGQIVYGGSAHCGAEQGGGGGGTIGYYYSDSNYCSENWWWDSECSGPDDPYSPPKIN